MAETLDLSLFVKRHDGTAHMDLAIEGVGCAGCIRKIESGVRRLPGVVEARLNFTNRRLAVDWREDELAAADLIAALEEEGAEKAVRQEDSKKGWKEEGHKEKSRKEEGGEEKSHEKEGEKALSCSA